MKSYSPKFGFCAVAAFGLALISIFTACGDSNTTEVTEQTGMDVLAKGEKLPDCTKDNAGDMLYVADSAAVYYCADGKWATLNGKDGEPGKDGIATDGKPGTGCSTKTVDNGIEVSCDGKVIGTVKNGASAIANDGDPGVGCTIDETAGNGIVKVTCGKGADEKTVTLYKAMCGAESYDPAKKFCSNGELFSCGDEPYDPAEKFCSEGKLYSCDGKPFDPAKQYCLTIKDENGEPVSKIEALLIYGRDENNVQAYKTLTIKGSYKVTDEQTKKETAVQYEEIWMAENLNYNTNTESETNSWCGGGESGTKNEGDCSVYGRLYTWKAATSACPDGWHLPSNAEWETLFKVVDAKYTLELNTVGQKLKANSSLWENYSGVKNDDTFGFSVLPAGFRDYLGYFSYEGDDAYFWSASENSSNYAYEWGFTLNYDDVYKNYFVKNTGFSVRCLRTNTN